MVEITDNRVGIIDVSSHLKDGYCGKGVGEEWGIVRGGSGRVECGTHATPKRANTVPISGNEYHLVYSVQGKTEKLLHIQLGRVVRSAWSAYTIGCGTKRCRARLRVHVFCDRIDAASKQVVASVQLRGLHINLHVIDFSTIVTMKYRVWGKFGFKLSLKSNFFRFYAPSIFKKRWGATSLLYLDSDSLFLNEGLESLFGVPLRQAMASGVQRRDVCWFGKIVDVTDSRVPQSIDPSGDCLTASVLYVNVSEWLRLNVTGRVEKWAEENARRKLWSLGSMPPLMLAAEEVGWQVLPNIMDGKGRKCTQALHNNGGAMIIHPMKDQGCREVRSSTICMPSYDVTFPMGSRRCPSLRARAIARMVGTKVQSKLSVDCDVVFYLNAPERARAPTRFGSR